MCLNSWYIDLLLSADCPKYVPTYLEPMENKTVVTQVQTLDLAAIQPLVEENTAEGWLFLGKAVLAYEDGRNRFEKPGEALFIARQDNVIIGLGGLNVDPYLGDPRIGRVRHVHVLKAWRGHGVGHLLLASIMNHARQEFKLLTLRTSNPVADRFYRKLGFVSVPAINNATHHLQLTSTTYLPRKVSSED